MEELTNLAVVKEVDRDIQVFLEKAGIVTIKTVADVEKAETIRKEIRVHLKAIDEKLDPFREAAHKAYQGWLTLIKAQKGRLETLEAVLVKSVREWKAEEDRKAQELRAQEAARIDRENREREERIKAETARLEKEQLDKAAELEAAGDKKAAANLLNMASYAKEQAELSVPIVVAAPVVLEPTVKLDGRTFGDKWHAEVVDMRLLCQAVANGKVANNLIEPNWSQLNKLAKLLKDELDIPGVKAIKE